jgi:HlyD family secretion protein
MNKTVKWILLIVAILAGGFVIAKVVSGKDKGIKVSAEKAAKRTIIETVTASGNIYPEVEVKISPDISGEITELNVQEGDSVKRGQVLARVFADIYALQRDEAASQVNRSQATVANSNAALEALQASLDQAKQTYDRNKSLYDQKIISKSELEQYETTYRSAQANYNAAKENIRSLQAGVQSSQTGLTKANKDLSRTVLISPMDGVISSLKVKKGERVAGNSFNIGTEMMIVANMEVLEVRVNVPENDIVKVNYGDSADVEVEAYNRRKFKGIVTQIASSTKTSGSSVLSSNDVTSYEVRIRLDENSYRDLLDTTKGSSKPKRFPFRPGMNASADIKTKRHDNVLSVPINSVNTRVKGSDKSMADKKKEEQEKKLADNPMSNEPEVAIDELEVIVFVLQKDGTVKKRIVKTGIQDTDNFEILEGLKEGDEVITGPYNAISEKLKEGMKVKVVPKEELFKK